MSVSYDKLKEDLKTKTPYEFFICHIAKAHPWYFSDYLKCANDCIMERVDYFREMVSKNFNIGFHSVYIVGSAKTGFSLSPRKILTKFRDGTSDEKASDIDIAIISDKLYKQIWDDIRKSNQTQYNVYYDKLAKSIFNGFVYSNVFLQIDDLRNKYSDIIDKTNRILQDKLNFEQPISYRVYRSWEDLQDYQIKSIKQAKKVLGD